MVHQPTFDEMFEFIETTTAKGRIGSHSGNAIQSTLRRVKPVLDDREAADVDAIDVDALIRRFSNLNRDVGPSSLKSYSSRIKSAIKMFSEWREDPTAWKPRSTGGGKPDKPTRASKAAERDVKPPPEGKASDSEQIRDDSRLSYPFPLREGIIVRLNGLPPDLTEADVERIARFLRVLCVD